MQATEIDTPYHTLLG